MQYTEEQIARANQTDLVSFLNAQGEQLVKSGREYRWKKHDSVTISGNRWYRHSQSKGGYPVDFVMEFYYATFPEAVKILIGEEGEGRQKSCPAPSKDFRLPEKNEDNEKIMKYLTEKREIEKTLVEDWIDRGDIYEEKKHHNVIFVGRDADGIPRYAHCRGTGEIKYRGDVTGSDKSYGFSYRGTDNQLFVFEAAIDLLSFIQLFPKDWKKRSYLSLGGVSSVTLMTFLSERPQITSVFLCLDNDQAGNEACEKLAGEISEGYSVIRLKPYKKDWNEILCDKNADRKKAIAETITIKVPESEERVPMLCYEDIEQTSVEWLWFPYIPFGKLTIIQGNPGEGKTYFAMMLTAACTNRKLFPNMEDIEPFNVIYQTAEDGMGDTIKPRLVEAGADLSRVMVIDDTEEALTLSDDRIEKAVRQNHVRLVIIDPVQAFIGADVDMNRANEVRPVFRKLGMIAEKTGCAIVLIGHLNKSSGTQSTYRGLGSIDIMAAVRSLIFIGKVRKDPTTRVLIHEKSSLAPPGETMAFKLGDEEGFRWVGAYEISADELLDGKEGKATETKLERGAKLIRELLADKKEISIRELDEKAKEQGISGRTMRDVRSRMKNELEYKVNEKQENSIRLKE
ncbi:AAA family ATPase [Blautia luti]|uniref:AAA family ATPase n=1 Tax=Blautia luti TaxID=89014 RepID=UPI0015704E38|nr:AAA family ATPase [Blautia luti]NSK86451.1 AAA family ATPase [Blautia luti]